MSEKLDAYATHLPLLVACVAHTAGPVCELGCGIYSTPVLDALCLDRELLSVESDGEWYQRFRHMNRGPHRVIHVQNWADAPIDRQWSIALIDHSPCARRIVDIGRLANLARLIVVHDTEHRVYGYEPVLEGFKHRVEWRRYAPWTSVVSNFAALDWLNPLL